MIQKARPQRIAGRAFPFPKQYLGRSDQYIAPSVAFTSRSQEGTKGARQSRVPAMHKIQPLRKVQSRKELDPAFLVLPLIQQQE